MSNKDTQRIEPSLRFPEFLNAGSWEIKPLKEICEILNNRRQPISSGNRIKGQYPYYGASGIVDFVHNYIFNERLVLVGEDGAKWGAFEKTAFIAEGKYWVNNHAHVLRPTKIKDTLLENYLIMLDMRAFVTGAAPPKLTLNKLKEIPIPLPLEQSEQQKIADCLSSIDELITAESKKLDALKIYKKGLMQQLFPADGETLPKLRFPEFIASENWEKIRIIDLASKEIKWSFTGGPFGSNLKSSDYTNIGIRVIQLQNIGDGEFVDNYKIYTSENKANELLSCNIYPGEIILSKMGDPVARACLIPDKEKRYLMCSDGIRLAVDKNKFDNYFIYSFINSEAFRAIAEKSSTGSTRKRIGLDILKNLKIMVPTVQEQQKIAEILYLLDNFISNQSKKIEMLKSQKRGLMQQLFPSAEGVMG